MRGFYVIGVQANQDLKYSLVWRHSRYAIQYPVFSQLFTVSIPPQGQANLVVFNSFDDDLYLELNTHHNQAVVYVSTM